MDGRVRQGDPNLIPFAVGSSNLDGNIHTSQMEVNADYRLEIATLADLGHITWIHPDTVGGSMPFTTAKPSNLLMPNGLKILFWVRNAETAGAAKHLFPPEARFDLCFDITHIVPCTWVLHYRMFTAGTTTKGESNGKLLLDPWSSQAVTPRDGGWVDDYGSWGASREIDFTGASHMLRDATDVAFREIQGCWKPSISASRKSRIIQESASRPTPVPEDGVGARQAAQGRGGAGALRTVPDSVVAIQRPNRDSRRSENVNTTTREGQQKASGIIPLTGSEYLEGLKDGREVWIHGERVKDVTTHPAFRNSARSVARLYDALHDPKQKEVLTTPTDTGNGSFTHPFYKAPRSREDLVAARDAIAAWQRLGFGFMGRSPDYKASFLATLGANSEFYAPYQANAQRWYKLAQERVLYLNHAIVHPPIDKHKPPDEVSDVCVHVEKETDAGIVVSGAKVVATASALTHYNFVGHYGLPMKKPEFAAVFMVPMDAPGLKLICRQSYEMVAAHCGSPFDYPMSSRLDENDSIMVFDKVLVPWENVFIYRDVQKVNDFAVGSGFFPRALFHGCTRLAVKLDFLSGLFLRAVEMIGTQDARNIQVAVGEVMAWRNLFWAIVDGMIQDAKPWVGDSILPSGSHMHAYRVFSTSGYGRIKELMEQTLGSSLIYLCSNAADLKSPELRPFIDRYIRGANDRSAVDRIKLMKLVWDSLASEFGGRHELYERNYAGNWEDARVQALSGAIASGEAAACTALVDQCLSEYDLDGWRLPGFINPDDVNVITRRQAR